MKVLILKTHAPEVGQDLHLRGTTTDLPDKEAEMKMKTAEEGGPLGGPLVRGLGASMKVEDKVRQLDKKGWQALYEEKLGAAPDSKLTIAKLTEAIEAAEKK